MHNISWLTGILLFVGGYYSALYVIAKFARRAENTSVEDFFYFIIIPAKNEEKVIYKTVKNCLKLEGNNYRVIVVDDGSTDKTTEIVENICKNSKKVVLFHNLPTQSKKGKGAVLNYAFSQIKLALSTGFVHPFHIKKEIADKFDKNHIIIGVFDADADPSTNMLSEISKAFSATNADAIQTTVRISNRAQSLLSAMQDIEFLGFSRIVQKARSVFGSVGLGGNGQFTRLSALESLGKEPWGNTLTEDLELGLRLISKGKKLYFIDSATVEQEGLISLKALIKQRTRWLQGHFMNWKYIPSILTANIPLKTKIDTIIYIVFVSVVFLVGLSVITSVLSIFRLIVLYNSFLAPFYDKSYLLGTIVLIIYSFAFIPMFVDSVFKFYANEKLPKKLLYIILFACYTYVWIPAGIIGLYRLITGKTTWVKTERVNKIYVEASGNQYSFRERRASPRLSFHTYIKANYNEYLFIINVSKNGMKVLSNNTQIEKGNVIYVKSPLHKSEKAKVVWTRQIDKDLIEAGLMLKS